jgi:hypothetical protein
MVTFMHGSHSVVLTGRHLDVVERGKERSLG